MKNRDRRPAHPEPETELESPSSSRAPQSRADQGPGEGASGDGAARGHGLRGAAPNRALVGTVVVLALALLVAVFMIWVSDSGAVRETSASESTTIEAGTPLVEPVQLPPHGAYVDSRVQSDGTVEVTQYLRGTQAISELTVSVFDSAQVDQGGSPQAVDLQVRTTQGRVVVPDPTVGSEPRRIDLVRPTLLVQLDYTLTNVTAEQSSPPGRALVGTVAMDVDFDGREGQDQIAVGGRFIWQLACTSPENDLAVLPCGAERRDGWSVRLESGTAASHVVTVVQLDQASDGTPDR